jgi:hypothetical protein
LRRHEILDRVNAIIESASRGAPTEDSLVELKAKIPDGTEKAARQLGGHANAAGGEPLLWLIGIQENGTVIGASKRELANWYSQVRSRFDGPAPKLRKSLAVPVGDKTVCAILFGTDDPPYVVNREDGIKEVPWREANSTRQASRSELLTLLRDYVALPDVQFLDGELDAHRRRSSSDCTVTFRAHLYVKPRSRRPIIIPRHECKASLTVKGLLEGSAFPSLNVHVLRNYSHVRSQDIEITRAGAMELEASLYLRSPDNCREMPPEDWVSAAEVEVFLPPANAKLPITLKKSFEFRFSESLGDMYLRRHEEREQRIRAMLGGEEPEKQC